MPILSSIPRSFSSLKTCLCPGLAACLQVLLLSAALLLPGMASEGTGQVGPFQVHPIGFDPADPQPQFIARDGTQVDAMQVAGDAVTGSIDLQLWAGDNQLGGWGMGALNLHGPVGTAGWIGLRPQWRISEGSDAAGVWHYHPRFAQDGVLTFGYGRVASTDLPSGPESDFHLSGTQDYDRVVVVLPFRWVPGGGSSYQTGLYGGNPRSAGVWAIPAGMRLSQVQGNPGTYLLARLQDVLGELPPHRWHSRFHLDVDAAYPGGWALAIDMNGDGTVDRRTHGGEGNHKALPFPPLGRESGLVVDGRPAFGVHGGLVGRTDIALSYTLESAPVIPGVDPAVGTLDRRPVTVNLPNDVRSSPVLLDGQAWSPSHMVSISAATLGPAPVPVAQISGSRQWFQELPLDPNQDTVVTVSQSGTPLASEVSGSITWQPVSLYHDESITIPAGSTIKLQMETGYPEGAIRLDADGDGVIDHTGIEAEIFLHTYPTPGVFQAVAYNDADEAIGSATITVVSLDLPERIAAEVGFTRTLDIHTGIYDPADLVITTNDPNPAHPELIEVQILEVFDHHLRISLRPLARGTPIIHIRQGSAAGPILAWREIDEFTVDTSRMQNVVVDASSRRLGGVVTMTPWIPDLEFTWDIFANRTSFGDGQRFKNLSTNDFTTRVDPVSGEVVADLSVELFVPHREDEFCMRGTFLQANSDPVPIGSTGNINGSGCELYVHELSMCIGEDPKPLSVEIVEVHDQSQGLTVTIQECDDPEATGDQAHFTSSAVVVEPGGSEPSNVGDCGTPFNKTINMSCKPKGEHKIYSVCPGDQCCKYDVMVNSTTFVDRIQVSDLISLKMNFSGTVSEADYQLPLIKAFRPSPLSEILDVPILGSPTEWQRYHVVNGPSVLAVVEAVGKICESVTDLPEELFILQDGEGILFREVNGVLDNEPFVVIGIEDDVSLGGGNGAFPGNTHGPGSGMANDYKTTGPAKEFFTVTTPDDDNQIYLLDKPGLLNSLLDNATVGTDENDVIRLQLRQNFTTFIATSSDFGYDPCLPVVTWHNIITFEYVWDFESRNKPTESSVIVTDTRVGRGHIDLSPNSFSRSEGPE